VIEIICVTYNHGEKLKCFINSIKAQSDSRWLLHIIHDGKDDVFHSLKDDLEKHGYLNDKVILSATEKRYNDFGHSLRDYGLKNPIGDSEYIVITNGDNYYAPTLIETLHSKFPAGKVDPQHEPIAQPAVERIERGTDVIGIELTLANEDRPDMIMWDLISHHSHMNWNFDRNEPYGVLDTELKEACVDMGSVAMRTEIAQKVGFNSRVFAGDWHYFNECYKSLEKPIVLKIPQILLVHN
jgi:glycosyltransferase involved in cell wall biosynthesis